MIDFELGGVDDFESQTGDDSEFEVVNDFELGAVDDFETDYPKTGNVKLVDYASDAADVEDRSGHSGNHAHPDQD